MSKEPSNKDVTVIGRAEVITFTEMQLQPITARIDTGAKTSSVWASNIHMAEGKLCYTLFDDGCPAYTGQEYRTTDYSMRAVTSSNGATQVRYVVKLLVTMAGRKIRASFTLADRSTQVYPALVGRNVLRGKFIVDVRRGQPLIDAEKRHKTAAQELARKTQEKKS